jgi:uncharacterized protein
VALPAPWVLGGLAGGVVVAAGRSRVLEVPRPLNLASQAVVGVALGAQVRPTALAGVAEAWWLVLGVVVITLALSVAIARLLARVSELDGTTATIGMLPGAAPALIAVGDEVGADARLVAVMQFGRLLLVIASVPVLVLLLGPGGTDAAAGGAGGPAAAALATGGGLAPLAWAVALGAFGVLVGARLRAPAAALVGPLVLAALASATEAVPLFVPVPLADAAFALVGLSVGFSFDRASLRHAGRLAPFMAGGSVGVIAGCAAVGALLVGALDVDPLTAYLATTPGGISGVLAAAFDSGADLTVVVAVQTSRFLLLALVAPFAVRALFGRAPA